MLMDPFPFAISFLRDTGSSERCVKGRATCCAPCVLDPGHQPPAISDCIHGFFGSQSRGYGRNLHGREGRVLRETCDLDVLEIHLSITPIREDCIEMLAEMSPRGVAEHVIRQHLIEVVEAASASHTIHGVVDGLMVPVLKPAFVELVEDFLLLDFPFGVVILGGDENFVDGRSYGEARRRTLFLGMLSHSYVLSMLVYADCGQVPSVFLQCMASSEVRLTASLTKPFLSMMRMFKAIVSRGPEL